MEKERYWTFIMYPESMPQNYKEILQETGLKIGMSPLHDKDKNADETQKKEHYHVILCFNGPTTYNRVEKITKELGGTIPKRVLSPIGMIRYFTHKDNPEKAQYNEEDIKSFNGFDPKDFDGITQSMEIQLSKAIINIINIEKIEEYSELIDYLIKEELRDMYKIASKNTIFYNSYLKSKKSLIDKERKYM